MSDPGEDRKRSRDGEPRSKTGQSRHRDSKHRSHDHRVRSGDGEHEHRSSSSRTHTHHDSERKRKDRNSESSSRSHRSSREDLASSSKSHTKRRRDDDLRHSHHHSHRSRDESRTSQHSEQETGAIQPSNDFVPTSESLSLTSSAVDGPHSPVVLRRDDWMTAAPIDNSSKKQAHSADGDLDESSYFSSLGKARVKAPRPEKPDPEKLKISSRELNTQLVEGKTIDEYQPPSLDQHRPAFGSPGFQWRMSKLKRVFEAATDQGRQVEDLALERYASLSDFDYAKQERDFLDGKERRSDQGRGAGAPQQSVALRMLANGGRSSEVNSPSSSRPSSRQGFRRPGEMSNPSTPTPSQPSRPPRNIGFDTPLSKPSTPTAIPSVFTPVLDRSSSRTDVSEKPRQGIIVDDGSADPDRPVMAADELNKLQAKIMKAELMGDPSVAELKTQFDQESSRSQAHKTMAGDRGRAFGTSVIASNEKREGQGVLVGENEERELQVLPTLDGRGRMYDVGSSSVGTDEADPSATNHSRKNANKKDRFEARDPQTGQIVRYSADDDNVSLGDLVRAEKFSAGSRTQKDLDTELASNIMTDAAFSTDLNDQDDEAHRYARKKMKSDALKRQFAINDFAKTKKVLDTCRFCWQDEGARPPKATVISTGYRAYLAIPDAEPIVEGHTLIVPMQHHLSSLEADQDTWDEMKNFIKCLIQLAASRNQSMVFFETVLSLKHQAHTVIEAVPVPQSAFSTLPGVFKESLRMEGGEFSSNSKIIALTPERPFRKSLVPHLPYFVVSWDSNFTTGYGHIIEGMDKDHRDRADVNAFDIDELGSHTGFSKNFARQVITGVLMDSADNSDSDTHDDFRIYAGKVKKVSEAQKQQAKDKFQKEWDRFDWTKMLQ